MTLKIIQEELEKELKSLLKSKDAQDVISKASWDDDSYTIKFKITNESEDRDGEKIIAEWINWKFFDKNPVILIDHRYQVSSIAWKSIKREIKGKDTFLTVQLAKWVEAWELVKTLHEQGMIKGVSIWFMVLERDATDRNKITKSEALEASFVAIGSNRDALIQDEKLYKKCKEFWLIKWEEDEKKEEDKKDEEIDMKKLFNMIKEIQEDVTSLKNTKTLSDDKEKENEILKENIEETQKKWQALAKHLSVFLWVVKEVKN